MNTDAVLYEDKGNYCRLILNREDKCHAINEEMIEALEHHLIHIDKNSALRMVEITATGDKFFCAGGDIKSWSTYSPLDMGRQWIKRGNDVFERLRNLSKITIANINGHAIGGGLELALACDFRIARPHAKFSTPEVTLGMIPGWMGIERILATVTPSIAREMLLLGKRLTASEAQQAGLLNDVLDKASLPLWFEEKMAAIEKCGPVAVSHIKQLMNSLTNKHSAYEHQLLAALMAATEDCQSATRAFTQKTSPAFANK